MNASDLSGLNTCCIFSFYLEKKVIRKQCPDISHVGLTYRDKRSGGDVFSHSK